MKPCEKARLTKSLLFDYSKLQLEDIHGTIKLSNSILTKQMISKFEYCFSDLIPLDAWKEFIEEFIE